MTSEEFKKYGHDLIDWMAGYFDTVESYPVKPDVEPGNIFQKLPDQPPEKGEMFETIMEDFNKVILPGMTHWQHPSFFAYFNGNNSKPSVLAEMLTATLGAQCMSWITSPAAAELEEKVMNWLRDMLGLPAEFEGVIQDTASTANLCALITAREKISSWNINESGFRDHNFRVYASEQAHSSIEKAVKIAGIGSNNLVKVPVDENFSMIPDELEAAVKKDIENGNTPLCVFGALGTTSSTAVDPLDQIGEITSRHNIWFHVDAAYSGTALLAPEFRWMSKGVELADSFVVNPHKWMFTNFDCSAYYVKDPEALVATFSMTPEYLKTDLDKQVNNYRDWGIQLGRRFRALKLWFVIRSFGVEGLREKIRYHVELAQWLVDQIRDNPEFELMTPAPVSTVCFRYHPHGRDDQPVLNRINKKLLAKLNQTGKVFMTHTVLNGSYVIRMVTSQTEVKREHVEKAWELIRKFSKEL